MGMAFLESCHHVRRLPMTSVSQARVQSLEPHFLWEFEVTEWVHSTRHTEARQGRLAKHTHQEQRRAFLAAWEFL